MKKTYLFLTGGLGNQLFQFAAALSLGQKSEIVLDVISGNPRNSSHEKADLLSIFSGLGVSIDKKERKLLSSKIGGYILRSGAEPRKFEQAKLYQRCVRLFASIYFSMLYFEFIVVKANSGVGYSEVGLSSRLNTFLFGYFQSFRWVEQNHVRESMNSLTIQNPSEDYAVLLKQIMDVKPVIMHVRRGDYAFEPKFGVLSKTYYKNGLEHLRNSGITQEVWVFTDDPDWAKLLISSRSFTSEKIMLVDDSKMSTGEVFELMRFGSAYVIANSSFSWWAAYLSRVTGANVVAPEPWFIGLPEPESLIPSSWKRFSGFEPKI
jgi:hypothetical protein